VQKVLITGSEGFVGKVLLEKLGKNRECHTIDIKTNSRKNHITFDLADPRLKELLVKLQPSVIVHLAAQTDVRISMETPFEDLKSNGLATLNLLQSISGSYCENFIYINSGGAIYSPKEKVPYTETSVIKPESAYGVTKQLAEDYVRLFCERSNISWKSLALSNVYGPVNQNQKGIFYQVWRAMHEKEKFTIFGEEVTRDYVHVLDVVSAIESAILSDEIGRFNIGTGVETSNLQVFNMMKIKMRSDLEYAVQGPRPGEVLRSALDFSRAKSKLGWEPRIDLQTGVNKILEGLGRNS
jgi:UDP-glucose 4-epimerase